MKKTFAVILIAAAVLLGATLALDTVARQIEQEEHIWLMETLLYGGKDFVKLEYDGEDENIRSVHQCDVGFIVETVTYGYADEIRVVVGLDNDGKVMGVVVLDAHETVGLGSKILTDNEFLFQFLNKNGVFAVGEIDAETATGDEISIDGISGATVSSKAVVRCVNSAVAYVTGADLGSSATEWG